MEQYRKRILTDIAGYGLLLLALLTGWLPGPGGIPLALAGLALLSVHNAWARRLRDYLLEHGKTIAHRIFADNPIVQLAFDVLVLALLAGAAVLAWEHDAYWQFVLSISLFCTAIALGLLNRNRLKRITRYLKHKR